MIHVFCSFPPHKCALTYYVQLFSSSSCFFFSSSLSLLPASHHHIRLIFSLVSFIAFRFSLQFHSFINKKKCSSMWLGDDGVKWYNALHFRLILHFHHLAVQLNLICFWENQWSFSVHLNALRVTWLFYFIFSMCLFSFLLLHFFLFLSYTPFPFPLLSSPIHFSFYSYRHLNPFSNDMYIKYFYWFVM